MRTLTIREIITVFLIVLLLTTQAHAGPLTGLVNYFQSNIINDIITLAIIGLGIVLFSAHVNWWLIIGICAGCWIIMNPGTISAAFNGG